LIAGAAASSVLLLLLRYDPRLVPAVAATVVLLAGAVRASQAGAWLPFATDAVVTVIVAVWLTRYLQREGAPRAPEPATGDVAPRASGDAVPPAPVAAAASDAAGR
jgi:CHASE2 domain-containing sensor protein